MTKSTSDNLIGEILNELEVPADKQVTLLQDLDELIWNETILLLSEDLPEQERQKLGEAFQEKNPESVKTVTHKYWPEAKIQAALQEALKGILKDYLETMTANISDEQREKIKAVIEKYQATSPTSA